MPQDHLLNRKAAALHLTRVYTVRLQYAIMRYRQKAYSLPYQSNSNVLFFQL